MRVIRHCFGLKTTNHTCDTVQMKSLRDKGRGRGILNPSPKKKKQKSVLSNGSHPVRWPKGGEKYLNSSQREDRGKQPVCKGVSGLLPAATMTTFGH